MLKIWTRILKIYKRGKPSKMDFTFCRIAFTIILGNNETKRNRADNKNYLYTPSNSYCVCLFSTHRTLSHSSHSRNTKLFSKILIIIANKVGL